MSKEFNYKRAWKQFIKPEYDSLNPMIHMAFKHTEKLVDSIHQNGASHQVTGAPADLVSRYDKIPAADLAWGAQVVYYLGHLASDKTAQEGGLYWKFQIIADTNLIDRGATEEMHQAKMKMERALKDYDDHEEGTEYADDEIAGIIPAEVAGDVEILKVDHVNYKPHPFMIGPEHFPKDGGMYLDVHQAPCAMRGCQLSYEDHTSDRVMFVRASLEDKAKLQTELKKIVDFLNEKKIKVDGFAFVK